MRLCTIAFLVSAGLAACTTTEPAPDDGPSTAAATEASASSAGTADSAGTAGPSPGNCSQQMTRPACMAHVGSNDIGETVPDCSWVPTYAVTDLQTCAAEESGGYCTGIVFDDTCGQDAEQCENGKSVAHVMDPDGTVRITWLDYTSYCGFGGGMTPCTDLEPGGATDEGSAGDGGDPPECACGCNPML